jgi:endo-1,4-beta-xylanase
MGLWGIATAGVAAALMFVPAAGAADRDVPLRGGVAVSDRAAEDRRALELRGNASIRGRVRGPVAVRVRARGVGCTGVLRVKAGRLSTRVSVAPRFALRVLTLPKGSTALVLKARAGCRIRVDEVRAQRRDASPAPSVAPPAPVHKPVLGAAMTDRRIDDKQHEQALASFGSITPENELKMEITQPGPGRFDFDRADVIVGYAASRGLQVRGHALVYGSQTPPWVGDIPLPERVEHVLRDHIARVIGRYKDRIREWDVVNEALDAHGKYRWNHFQEALGEDYVRIAFEAARAADPTAKLYYNELDADIPGEKRAAVAKLVGDLKNRGLIDGVGLQMHTGLGVAPTREQVADTIRLYEGMGLEVQITELDVAARGDGTATYFGLRLKHQAEVYRAIAEACAEVRACKKLTVWGVTDRHSWLGAEQIPLLFDTEYRPKPSLHAVQEALGLLQP